MDPRIGSFRSISRRLMPAIRKDDIGCPASGRSQRTHARGRKSAPPFLRTRHPFLPHDSPARKPLGLTEEQDEGKKQEEREGNEIDGKRDETTI